MRTVQAFAVTRNNADCPWERGDLQGQFRGIQFPASGKTFLYGMAEPVGNFLINHRGTEGSVRELAVSVPWRREKARLDDLECRFFNAHRVDDEFSEFLATFWQERIGGFPLRLDNFPGETTHPYILDELVNLPRFSNLDAVAYSVNTYELSRVHVITIFNKSIVEGV